MSEQKAPTGSRLGDSLRALARLRPTDDSAGQAILQVLGTRPARVAPAPTAAPTPEPVPAPELEEPAIARPQRPLKARTEGEPPPERPATLEPLDQDQEAAPAWLEATEPLAVPLRAANPYAAERDALFEPKLQRALITRLAATWQDGGELDLAAVLRQVCSGRPLRSVPRRLLVTTRKGVRLLVDQSDSMAPFQQDLAQLAQAFRRTVGASRLRVEAFIGVPSRDVRLGADWRRYRPDNLGTALVVVSDMGLPPLPLSAPRVSVQEWRAFLALERRAGHAPVVVLPREASALGPALRQQARFVPWGRRAGVRSITAPGQGTLHLGHEARRPDGAAMPAGPAAGLPAALARLDADTLRLAMACSLAVRVEPPLLRALRLAVMPGSGAELEARLWFSPVFTDRAATGLVMDARLREGLHQQLRSDPALLAQSWQVLQRAHANAAPALQAEEEACYHWLRGAEDEARAVLRRMVATVVNPSRDGAWRWAHQALPRLPRSLMDLAEAQMLAVGTALRSGDGGLIQGLGHGGGAWHWLQPAARLLELAVTLREGAIEFAPPTARSALIVRVPDQPAVLIEIQPLETDASAETARINPRQRTLLPVAGDAFELQVLGGERYRLQAQVSPPPASAQKFIPRNEKPRVRITYDAEFFGEKKQVELPFVMGVMADLSGHLAEATIPLAERQFVDFDVDNFDVRMGQIQPLLRLRVPDRLRPNGGELAVELVFQCMADFEPAGVVRQVEPLALLLQQRQRLAPLQHLLDRQEAEDEIAAILGDPAQLRQASQGLLDVAERFAKALDGVNEADRDAIADGLQTLAILTLQGSSFESKDSFTHVQGALGHLDFELTAQLNEILHHPDFQALEGAWRGLHYLVSRTDTDEMLKIRVLDISKRELDRTLRRHAGPGWTDNPLYKKIHDEAYGQFGGEPFGCLAGDYAFDHSPADVKMLTEMSRIAAAAHAPFITGASPQLFEMETWQNLNHPRDLNRFLDTPEFAAWTSLRESEEARYLALAMPRVLARLPYGSNTNPVEAFDFDEGAAPGNDKILVWMNSAYAMAANINRAFKEHHWLSRIRGVESGGAVSDLPVFTFPTDDGGMGMQCPTEIAVSDRREAELSRAGLMPLVHRKNSDFAAFLSASSLQKLHEYEDPEATANATLAARLPYLFACTRFMHYLKCIVRDRIDSFSGLESMQQDLNEWLLQYVDGDPIHSSEMVKAQRPLAAAEVQLRMPEPYEGQLEAQVFLKPHYQLEGLTISLRLLTRLPGFMTPA